MREYGSGCFAFGMHDHLEPWESSDFGPEFQCDARMYHMKSVSIRDLRYDFPKVERLLSEGNELQVTKRRKVIARLTPERDGKAPLPDFLARMRANYGDKVLEVSGAELISLDRDE
jgi:antitoxin (DNA-binding transcriptional repressor) of toxin-antitoxin stability system